MDSSNFGTHLERWVPVAIIPVRPRTAFDWRTGLLGSSPEGQDRKQGRGA
jgi:hypothetical protein